MSARLWVAPAAVSEEAAPEAVQVDKEEDRRAREVPEARGRIEVLAARSRTEALDRGNRSHVTTRNRSGRSAPDNAAVSLHAAHHDRTAVFDVRTRARQFGGRRIVTRLDDEVATR